MNRQIQKLRNFKFKLLGFLNQIDKNGIGISDKVCYLVELSGFLSRGPFGILICMVAMVVDFTLSLVCLLGTLALLLPLIFVDSTKGTDYELF